MEDVFDVEESQKLSCFWSISCVFVAELSPTNIKQIVINKSFREPFKHFKSHYDDKGKQIGRCKPLD